MAKSLKDLRERRRPLLVGVKPQQNYDLIMEEPKGKKKTGWGGKRQGAGRPVTNPTTRSIALRIPDDVAEILDRQENRSAYIIEAIRAYDREQRKQTILGIEISYTRK